MKLYLLATVGFSAIAIALSFAKPYQTVLGNEDQDLYLIELGPGETRWIAEEEKWALRRDGINFMDITETSDLGAASDVRKCATVQFPNKPAYNDSLVPLLKELKQKNMHKNLEKFTSFHTVRIF